MLNSVKFLFFKISCFSEIFLLVKNTKESGSFSKSSFLNWPSN